MTKLSLALVPLLALSAFALPGCGGTQVTRTDSNASKDLSGRWNDVDTKTTTTELVNKALAAPWLDRFIAEKKRKPILVVGSFKVRADNEIVNTSLITNALVEEFINSGKVTVLSDPDETRKVLEDQAAFAEKGKELGKESAADFILKGSIGTQNDQLERQSVKFYIVSVELADIQTRELAWKTNLTPIRKEVDQSRWK